MPSARPQEWALSSARRETCWGHLQPTDRLSQIAMYVGATHWVARDRNTKADAGDLIGRADTDRMRGAWFRG